MKKLKKMSIAIALLMVTFAVTSCSKEKTITPKATPEETAKIYLDMSLKNDKSNIDKIGLSDEEYEKIKNELDEELVKQLSEVNTEGAKISEEIQSSFRKEIFAGLSKVEYEVLPKSLEEDNARVEIKIKGFDMNKIIADSTEKVKGEYSANPAMTDEELMNSFIKAYGSYLANGTLAETATSLEFYMTLENDIWVPLNSDIMALGTAIYKL
jgi:5-bromo-4-chloroindolyl phosphate hydrolysis protein